MSEWGTLEVTVDDCANGIIRLAGRDGEKQADVIKLAGVAGSGCGSSGNSSALSGLWYSPALDGEGFNIVESDVGTLIYYYGFNRNGQRQWLVSDVIPDLLETGVEVTTNLYSSISGSFDTPVGSADSLEYWGTLSATRTACDAVSLDLRGRDGRKVTETIRLANVIGDLCP